MDGDRTGAGPALPPGTILQHRYLKERLSRLRPGRFVEVGCGKGFTSRVLLDAGWTGIGYDLNPDSLHPRACVFYNPQLVAFWNRSNRDMDALPLAHYIHRNFKVVRSLDDFSLLVRNDRDIERRSR
jgi:hypothetical protein